MAFLYDTAALDELARTAWRDDASFYEALVGYKSALMVFEESTHAEQVQRLARGLARRFAERPIDGSPSQRTIDWVKKFPMRNSDLVRSLYESGDLFGVRVGLGAVSEPLVFTRNEALYSNYDEEAGF